MLLEPWHKEICRETGKPPGENKFRTNDFQTERYVKHVFFKLKALYNILS